MDPYSESRPVTKNALNLTVLMTSTRKLRDIQSEDVIIIFSCFLLKCKPLDIDKQTMHHYSFSGTFFAVRMILTFISHKGLLVSRLYLQQIKCLLRSHYLILLSFVFIFCTNVKDECLCTLYF